MARSFLILHGWNGSGPEHWQTWLAHELEAAGEHVRYPSLPDCETPCPDAWGAALREELAALPDAGERVVICHSLGCVLWLRHAREARQREAERVLLVAPPCPCAEVPELTGFYPVGADAQALASAASETRLVCSDDDHYCPEGAACAYGQKLGMPIDLIAGAGHLNTEAGYGPWPSLLAWCLEARAPIVGNDQAAHRQAATA